MDDKSLGSLTSGELVAEGARVLRTYTGLHGDDREALRDVAKIVVHLRVCYEDSEGKPDLTGKTYKYKQAMQMLYTAAEISASDRDRIQSAVRWYVSAEVRSYMHRNHYTSADFMYYGIKFLDKAARHRRDERVKTRLAREARSKLD